MLRAGLAIARSEFKDDETRKPRNESLDHPAGLAQAAAVLGSAPSNLGGDASVQQSGSVWVAVIAPTGLDEFVSALGSAPFSRYRGEWPPQAEAVA